MKSLVLSGGGAKGAFQCGALKHLLGERHERYDIIAGTSVGALNGSFLSMFKLGEEAQAAHELEALWLGIDNSKIWRKWYHGLLGPLPVMLPKWLGGRQSVYSTAPLRELLKRRFKPEAIKESGKLLRVGAVNLNSGFRKVWTESDPLQIRDAVLASSSFPIFFEPVMIDGCAYTDAGVQEVSPVSDAIEAGATEIHLLTNSPDQVVGQFDPSSNGLALAGRMIDTMIFEIERWDVKVVELYNALVDAGKAPGKKKVKLTVLRPKQNLLDDSLDFDPAFIRTNIERGYADAREVDWGSVA